MGEGTHWQSYEKMGAHVREIAGVHGVHFAVWAPNALRVSVVGDFNRWDGRVHRDAPRGEIPACGRSFVPGSCAEGVDLQIRDSLAPGGAPVPEGRSLRSSRRSCGRSRAPWWRRSTDIAWNDDDWMHARAQARLAGRADFHLRSAPGFVAARSGRERTAGSPTARLADQLIPYVKQMGYTHIELMPVMEHPFDAPGATRRSATSRPPAATASRRTSCILWTAAIRKDIGVLLDWTPAHFPADAHGLAEFDGTHLYEHADPRQGRHPDWGTLVFNYGRVGGARISAGERALLDRQIPHRRAARGRRGLHALSRLFAAAGRMDSQRIRRARKSGAPSHS